MVGNGVRVARRSTRTLGVMAPLAHCKVTLAASTRNHVSARVRYCPVLATRFAVLRMRNSPHLHRSLVHSCSLYLVLPEPGPVHEVLSEPSSLRMLVGYLRSNQRGAIVWPLLLPERC